MKEDVQGLGLNLTRSTPPCYNNTTHMQSAAGEIPSRMSITGLSLLSVLNLQFLACKKNRKFLLTAYTRTRDVFAGNYSAGGGRDTKEQNRL